jgi:hypothetical protein
LRRHLLLSLSALALLAALLRAAAGADEGLPEGAIPLPDGGYALELAAPTPDWYTPALHAEVLAAGAEGVAIPEGVELPASALAFTGIRPGAWMISPGWCTMNFVFAGGGGGGSGNETGGKGNGNGNDKDKSNNGKGNQRGTAGGDGTVSAAAAAAGGSGLAIGTAGHCGEVGDEVVLVMAPGVLVYIGDITKSVDRGIGNDFALVSILPELADLVNPSMAIIAGPTATGAPAIGDPILHVGHGVAVGTGGTPRAGVVGYRGAGDGGDAYGWVGAATPGDSGSGVRHAGGEASGNLTHLVIGTDYLPSYIAGTTAERMEQIAGMSIVTASLIPDPLP